MSETLTETAPNPAHSAEWGVEQYPPAAQLGAVAVEHSIAEAPADTEAAPVPQLPEALPQRIEMAVEASSFKDTPEVRGAIGSYYKDHYSVGVAVERVLQGAEADDVADQALIDGISTHLLRETARDLLSSTGSRTEQLVKAEKTIYGRMFNEVSLPSETVGEPEQAYLQSLAGQLRQKAIDEGHVVQVKGYEDEYVWNDGSPVRHSLNRVSELRDVNTEHTRQSLWDDTRFAGQLEFHNSGNFAEIAKGGYVLRSRTSQLARNGEFKSKNLTEDNLRSFGMHSNVPHFSESYDPVSYKARGSSLYESDEAHLGAAGALAIPLAEIIKVAPYARDGQYGIAELKQAADAAQVVVKDGTTTLGPQGSDIKGKHGEDRVFFADYRAENADGAVNYDLTPGENGLQMFTESDRKANNGMGFGVGQGLPGMVEVPFLDGNDRVYDSSLSIEDQIADREARDQTLANYIHDLQAKSCNLPEYQGKIVVPLREGVIEFEVEAARTREYQAVVQHSLAA